MVQERGDQLQRNVKMLHLCKVEEPGQRVGAVGDELGYVQALVGGKRDLDCTVDVMRRVGPGIPLAGLALRELVCCADEAGGDDRAGFGQQLGVAGCQDGDAQGVFGHEQDVGRVAW